MDKLRELCKSVQPILQTVAERPVKVIRLSITNFPLGYNRPCRSGHQQNLVQEDRQLSYGEEDSTRLSEHERCLVAESLHTTSGTQARKESPSLALMKNEPAYAVVVNPPTQWKNRSLTLDHMSFATVTQIVELPLMALVDSRIITPSTSSALGNSSFALAFIEVDTPDTVIADLDYEQEQPTTTTQMAVVKLSRTADCILPTRESGYSNISRKISPEVGIREGTIEADPAATSVFIQQVLPAPPKDFESALETLITCVSSSSAGTVDALSQDEVTHDRKGTKRKLKRPASGGKARSKRSRRATGIDNTLDDSAAVSPPLDSEDELQQRLLAGAESGKRGTSDTCDFWKHLKPHNRPLLISGSDLDNAIKEPLVREPLFDITKYLKKEVGVRVDVSMDRKWKGAARVFVCLPAKDYHTSHYGKDCKPKFYNSLHHAVRLDDITFLSDFKASVIKHKYQLTQEEYFGKMIEDMARELDKIWEQQFSAFAEEWIEAVNHNRKVETNIFNHLASIEATRYAGGYRRYAATRPSLPQEVCDLPNLPDDQLGPYRDTLLQMLESSDGWNKL